jgi:hypothetical protein
VYYYFITFFFHKSGRIDERFHFFYNN